VSEFYAARIRAEWQDWSFGANQAATRAAAAEELIALRRQYTELAEPDLLQLAQTWHSDSATGPYFTFTAADGSHLYEGDGGDGDYDGESHAAEPRAATEPTAVLLDALFVRALIHELGDQTPAALAALLDQWSEQRRHAAYAGLRPTHVDRPRVTLLLPRDDSRWPPASWDSLLTLDLDAQSLDGALLRWSANSERWLTAPLT